MLGNSHFIKRKTTRDQLELIKNRPGMNQNHSRNDQETSSLLCPIIPTHDSSTYFMRIKEVDSISSLHTFLLVAVFISLSTCATITNNLAQIYRSLNQHVSLVLVDHCMILVGSCWVFLWVSGGFWSIHILHMI